MNGFTAKVGERITTAVNAGGPNVEGLSEAIASDMDDLLTEIDDEKTRDDGNPFNAGWHAAVAEVRERLGLAS